MKFKDIGFALSVDLADDIEVDIGVVEKEVATLERKYLDYLTKYGVVRDEGHSSDGALIGTIVYNTELVSPSEFLDHCDDFKNICTCSGELEDLQTEDQHYIYSIDLEFFE